MTIALSHRGNHSSEAKISDQAIKITKKVGNYCNFQQIISDLTLIKNLIGRG